MPIVGACVSEGSPPLHQGHTKHPAKRSNCCLSGSYLTSEGSGIAFACAVSDVSAETARRLHGSREWIRMGTDVRRRCHEGITATLKRGVDLSGQITAVHIRGIQNRALFGDQACC
jgi:hypothetical protein